jgi:hypothetical protein
MLSSELLEKASQEPNTPIIRNITMNFGKITSSILAVEERNAIYTIENLNLEELATARQHRFQFICTPLKLVGTAGSPVRPVALVDNNIRFALNPMRSRERL